MRQLTSSHSCSGSIRFHTYFRNMSENPEHFKMQDIRIDIAFGYRTSFPENGYLLIYSIKEHNLRDTLFRFKH